MKSPLTEAALGPLFVRWDRAARGLLRASAPPADATVSVGEYRLYFSSANRDLAEHLDLTGEYEPATTAFVRSILTDGDSFVDGGANIGYFTVLGADLVGRSGRVYAFEPAADTAALLERSIRLNNLGERVQLESVGLSDRVGTARFFRGVSGQGDHIVPVATGSEVPSRLPTGEIDTTSLDSYFEERGWPSIRLVKLDIEGQEVSALHGMSGCIANNPDLVLIFEVHLGQLRSAGEDVASLLSAVRNLGMDKLVVLLPQGQMRLATTDCRAIQDLAHVRNLNVAACRTW